MNGRFFNEKVLECDYWDGKTNYKVVRDTPVDQQQRIDEFGKWLEGKMNSLHIDDDDDVENMDIEMIDSDDEVEGTETTNADKADVDGEKTPEI